mmetsp:Transcript_13545/g.38493  ORF Transcript_13545/g.38493 Transcript_13545/m.38493 type:complete len:310 (+) Transcript_13545:664-1593(+)
MSSSCWEAPVAGTEAPPGSGRPAGADCMSGGRASPPSSGPAVLSAGPAGTRSKTRRKPGARSSAAASPGAPSGPDCNTTKRWTWMQLDESEAPLAPIVPRARKSRRTALMLNGLLSGASQTSRADTGMDAASLPSKARLPRQLLPPTSAQGTSLPSVPPSRASVPEARRTRLAKSGTSTQTQSKHGSWSKWHANAGIGQTSPRSVRARRRVGASAEPLAAPAATAAAERTRSSLSHGTIAPPQLPALPPSVRLPWAAHIAAHVQVTTDGSSSRVSPRKQEASAWSPLGSSAMRRGGSDGQSAMFEYQSL